MNKTNLSDGVCKELTEEECKNLYDRVSAQIKREDNLIDHRVTYTLTFQSILFASLAFTARADDANQVGAVLREVSPMIGGGVALLGLMGVVAGFISINHHLSAWRRYLKGRDAYAAPSGNGFVLTIAWSMYVFLMLGIGIGWAYIWFRLN